MIENQKKDICVVIHVVDVHTMICLKGWWYTTSIIDVEIPQQFGLNRPWLKQRNNKWGCQGAEIFPTVFYANNNFLKQRMVSKFNQINDVWGKPVAEKLPHDAFEKLKNSIYRPN